MQIVGYEGTTPEGTPALYLADGGEVERVTLEPGATLAYALGERRCAGVLDGDSHTACDRASAPYCDRHTHRWPCARCTGECDLPIEACREEHAVYLAGFAPDTVKVGVTRSWRLRTRLREQGADRAAHLHTVTDGRIARRIEADVARSLTDRVRVPDKIRGLGRDLDETAWQDALAVVTPDPIEVWSPDYDLDLSAPPVPETLATGTVRGCKGRVLVLDHGGTTYGVDLRALVGFEVEAGGTDRDLQAGLGAFG